MDTKSGDGTAEELTALRRVAVLVARGAPPEEIFVAVTAEVGGLLDVDVTAMARFNLDKTMTIVAYRSASGGDLGTNARMSLGGRSLSRLVFETGRSARMDDYSQASGPAAEVAHRLGIRSGVGVPISVDGGLWGAMLVSSTSAEPLPADTETRLGGFTELVGAAIANAQARVELRGYAEEQAALRRVATLVAGGAPPEEVFAAVAAEAGRLLGGDFTVVGRYEPGDAVMVVGAWSSAGVAMAGFVGTAVNLGGRNMATQVFQTGRPVQIDDYGGATGGAADLGRTWGFRTAAGAPIRVEGRLWGLMTVASTNEEPLPEDTEARFTGFTELAGIAIANAEAQAALAASRARIVAAADEARRRIERDLHDGAQQRLVTLALHVQELQATAPPQAADLARQLDSVTAGLDAALADLRETARGIHPAVLARGGLDPALKALARRCPVTVELHVQVADRPPDPVEIAAYYIVSEALTNTAKHAEASAAEVEVIAGEGMLRICVRDDGRGGADFGHGSGLVGLKDRVEALGGRITLHSPPGEGTTLMVHVPLAGSHALR
jgi:signal transduction histidine kinase